MNELQPLVLAEDAGPAPVALLQHGNASATIMAEVIQNAESSNETVA